MVMRIQRMLRGGPCLCGGIIALAVSPGLLGAQRGSIQLVQDLKIDGYEADLVPVRSVALGLDGSIVVAQQQDHSLRFYGPNGTLVGTVGRQGSGPGEFERITSVAWLADTLWVWDAVQHRFTFVSSAGRVIRTQPWNVNARPRPADATRLPEFLLVSPKAIRTDGSVYAQLSLPRNASEVGYDANTSTFGIVSPDGTIQKLVAQQKQEEGIVIRTESGTAGASLPFPMLTWHAVSPSGTRVVLASTRDADGRVHIVVASLAATGDTVFDKSYPVTGIPIPRSVADSAIQARAGRMRNTQLATAYRRLARVPRVYPPLEGVVVSDEGRVWVRLRGTAREQTYLVLEPDGTPAGSAVLGPNAEVLAVRGSYVVALEKDEFDVPSIIRYRLAPRS